jgi:hypothetical protein
MTTAILAALLLQITGGAQTPAPDGLIAGRVVDGVTGKSVASAIVAIMANPAPRNEPVDRVLTDVEGRYAFDHLGKGSYTLTVTKPGWITGAYGKHRPDGSGANLDLAADARLNDVALPIWRYGALEGMISDDAGEPVVDLNVRAVRRRLVAGRWQLTAPRLARTDDRGIYRFADLMPGDYLVGVIASTSSEPAGFADAARAVNDTAPAGYLQTMAAIGTAPLAFAGSAAASTRDGVTLSSSAGAMTPPADGAWTTFATTFFPAAPGTASATPVKVVSGQERNGVNVQVRSTRTFQVSGVVSAPDGAAPFNAVHLVPAESADFPLFDAGIAITNAAGAFTFYGVTPGQYIARVVRIPPPPPNYRLAVLINTDGERLGLVSSQPQQGAMPLGTEPLVFGYAPVSVDDRPVSGVTLTLRPGPVVRGRAEFIGTGTRPEPAQWSSIRVDLEAANGASPEIRVMPPGQFSADATFTSQSMPPGSYFVRVFGPPAGWWVKSITADGRDVMETPLELASDVSNVIVTFTDQPETVSGTVAGNDPSTAVLLFPAEHDKWTNYGRTSRRFASARLSSGAFTIPAPPPGTYYLVAVGDEDSADWQDPAVLEKLALVAERVEVKDGESLTKSLTVKKIR